MARWRISFEVNLPDDVSADQAQEWASYNLHWSCSMSGELDDRLGEIDPVYTPRVELLSCRLEASGSGKGACRAQ